MLGGCKTCWGGCTNEVGGVRKLVITHPFHELCNNKLLQTISIIHVRFLKFYNTSKYDLTIIITN